MGGGSPYNGEWGAIYRPYQAQNNIVTYQITPFRQRAFAGYFAKGFYNLVRRVVAQAPYIVPNVALGYYAYHYCTEKYAWYHTKEGRAHAGH